VRGAEDAVLTAPPSGGRVTRVSEVGKIAARGQALCSIESEKYEAMLLQAKAALDLAKGELDRMKNNVEKGFVGKAVIDKAELDFQGARVAHLQAQRAYEDSRCQAPFSGMLVSRFVERHQSVPPGAPTVRVSGLDRVEAVVSIPESEAFDYREGQKAEFFLLQNPGNPVVGKIRSLDRAVEARNRTVTARIELPNPGRKLRPGMVGKARILRKRYDQALVVPSQAVLRLQGGTAMMRVSGQVAEKVSVVLGPALGDSVVVESGLSGGDRIITMGAFQVSEGTKVEC
jgi:membrane fusion protein (multidrug efflux system)